MTQNDIQQILQHGLTPEQVENQLVNFITGFPFTHIVAPATIDNKGIMAFSSHKKMIT